MGTSHTIAADEGHAWIVIEDLFRGTVNTYGRWPMNPNRTHGKKDKGPGEEGVYADAERGRMPVSFRSKMVQTVIYPREGRHGGWGLLFNNCVDFAVEAWEDMTGEVIDGGTGSVDHPGELIDGIREMNRKRPTGVRPPERVIQLLPKNAR